MDEMGISGDAKEALSFAILANETVSGKPKQRALRDGAKSAVVLGKIIPGR